MFRPNNGPLDKNYESLECIYLKDTMKAYFCYRHTLL